MIMRRNGDICDTDNSLLYVPERGASALDSAASDSTAAPMEEGPLRSTMRLNPNAVEIIKPTNHGACGANLSEEKVVLVNDRDEPIGTEGKTNAHLQGALHRAFSVFVVNA